MANNNDKFISRENAKTLWGYMIDLLTGKQNKLTFDDTPTQGSDNPVKSGGIFTALAGKGTYSKPQNGIPKTDLENAVQTSLGLADSALQSETDPTVPSWAKQTNKPSYTQDEVPDGTTYKRVTQTEKDAWSGKQNALTTTQMQAVNSGITSAGVAQISTNQSNILYAIRNGAKNLYKPILDPAYYDKNGAAITRTYSNGAITIKGTTATADAYLAVCEEFTPINTGDYVFSSASGLIQGKLEMYVAAGSSFVGERVTASNPARTYSLTAGTTYTLGMVISANYTIDTTIYPMLCEKTVWDNLNHDFQPPSLPNYDLTRLEAEDRASLVECVDGGAKNLFNPANVSSTLYGTWDASAGTFTQTGTDTKANLNLTLKARTSSSASWVEIFSNYDIATNGVVSIPFTCPINATEFRLGHNGSTQDTLMVMTGFNVTTGAQYVVQLNITNAVQASGKYSWNKIMVCTKAAFGVSSKFVPYRPNWDLVCQRSGAITKRNVTGTDWTLTDVSLTGSSGFVYFLSAGVDASGNYPTGILISTSNNSSDFMDASKLVCKNDDTRTTRMFSCAAIDMPYQSTTYYVWSKSTVSATNAVTLMWHKEPR